MKRSAKFPQSCPAEEAMEVFGGKWRVGIVHHLEGGPLRFNELRRKLPGITQKMLTQQLRHLQRFGILDRKQFAEIPPRVEYSLTNLGRSLCPLLDQISKWSGKHMPRLRQEAAAYDAANQIKKSRARTL
jgi:DNA-binding HxlR family transcriptional regulator